MTINKVSAQNFPWEDRKFIPSVSWSCMRGRTPRLDDSYTWRGFISWLLFCTAFLSFLFLQVDKILKVIPRDRKTFLFSATMTKQVRAEYYALIILPSGYTFVSAAWYTSRFLTKSVHMVLTYFDLPRFKNSSVLLWRILLNVLFLPNIRQLKNYSSTTFSSHPNSR